jgi:short-subunit dehydrogenase
MIATSLVLNGATVYITSRKESNCRDAFQRINMNKQRVPDCKGSCHFIPADLSSDEQAEILVQKLFEREPGASF